MTIELHGVVYSS